MVTISTPFEELLENLQMFKELAFKTKEKSIRYWYARIFEIPNNFIDTLAFMDEFTGWEIHNMLYDLEFGSKETAAMIAESIRRRYFTYQPLGIHAWMLGKALAIVRDLALEQFKGSSVVDYKEAEILDKHLLATSEEELGLVLSKGAYCLAFIELLFTVANLLTKFAWGRTEINEVYRSRFTQLSEHYYQLLIDPGKRAIRFDTDPRFEKAITEKIYTVPRPPTKRELQKLAEQEYAMLEEEADQTVTKMTFKTQEEIVLPEDHSMKLFNCISSLDIHYSELKRVIQRRKEMSAVILDSFGDALRKLTPDWNGKTFNDVVIERKRLEQGIDQLERTLRGISKHKIELGVIEASGQYNWPLVTKMAYVSIRTAIECLKKNLELTKNADEYE